MSAHGKALVQSDRLVSNQLLHRIMWVMCISNSNLVTVLSLKPNFYIMIFCFNYWQKTSTTTRDFFFVQPCYTGKIVLRRPACDMSNSLNCSRPPIEVTICGLLELYFKHCTSGTVSINISFICGILLCWSVRINTLWIFKHISAAGVASNLPRWHSHLCLRSCSALWSQVWSAETYLDEAQGRWGFSCSQ